MGRAILLALMIMALGLASQAQRLDLAAGVGKVSYDPPVSGYLWPSFSATFMPSSHFGFGAEVSHRFTGTHAKRASLMDFNFVYRPLPAARFAPELQTGWGGEFLPSQGELCLPANPAACQASPSTFSNAFHLGINFRLRLGGHFFLRPEYHLYFVQLNTASRFALSLGYSF